MSINDVNGNLHSNIDGRFTEKSGTRPAGTLTGAPAAVPTANGSGGATPVLPGSIAGYQVKNYRGSPAGPEGGAFTATVCRDGKRVFQAENDGWGGCNDYAPLDAKSYPTYRDEVTRFERVAPAALGEGAFEPGDAFLSLLDFNARIDRDAAKRGDDRAQYVELVIADSRQSPYPMTEAEIALLREPGTRFDTE